MDGIQMEPVGKYKADRNGSAKDTEKAREARDLGDTPVAVCSQRRALCVTVLVLSAIFVTSLLVVYATPQPGEVSIDFRVDRDTSFVVLNIRDMNVTERALFKGGSIGPKSLCYIKVLDDACAIRVPLQDEFASSPPMSPHMISISVCRLQRKSAPLLETATVSPDDEAQPVISLPLLEWVQKTLQLYSLDSSNMVRAVASPRLDRADIEAAADDLSKHKICDGRPSSRP
ncbi:unnamed protein product [Leptidea sinapis]|uniref:Uncharacterized protein n=1 Tax=Leptidea sinapis TaxID=189913 RepID=A0A5E4PZW3_9NEOP|nr:unnamed protein product [Leptidea sinapis]